MTCSPTKVENAWTIVKKPVPLSAFASEFVRAYEVIEDERFSKYAKVISEEIPALLGNSNGTASRIV